MGSVERRTGQFFGEMILRLFNGQFNKGLPAGYFHDAILRRVVRLALVAVVVVVVFLVVVVLLFVCCSCCCCCCSAAEMECCQAFHRTFFGHLVGFWLSFVREIWLLPLSVCSLCVGQAFGDRAHHSGDVIIDMNLFDRVSSF